MEIKKRARRLAYIFLILMILPLINISRYAFFYSEQVALLPNNHYRSRGLDLRGRILDRNNRVLAHSKGYERVYPFGESFEPILGYVNPKYSDAGLEKFLSERLCGYSVPRTPWQAYVILNKKNNRCGDDVVISLDVDVQREAYEALRGYRGAVVVLDVKTGEILALASRPAYDPNFSALDASWSNLCNNEEAPFFNRALQGLYPPGSTFKVLVMAGALEDNLTSINEIFDCQGSMSIGDYRLNCTSAHGRINLSEALAYSCNVVFANLGERLQMSGMRRWIHNFRLDGEFKSVPLSSKMHVPEDSNLAADDVTAIGQADTMVTPLHMARLVATIARGGEDIEPILVLRQLRGSKVVWRGDKDRSAKKVISQRTAALVAGAMKLTVSEGTGIACNYGRYSVAGKTGSAENPHGDTHAWFIGYAPVENPRIAIAVILENAGGGGKYAAPIAKEIIESTLPNYIAEGF